MRSGSLDLLKLVLALMVVAIHSHPLASLPLKMYFFLDHGIARIAVPIFFILNGYFLRLDRNNLLKWLKKSAIIYIALTLIYLPFFIDTANTATAVKQIVKSFVIGNAHLWYFPAMMIAGTGLYIIKNDSMKIIISLILFFASCTLQYLSSLEVLDIPIFIYRSAMFAFPFMVIGNMIRNGKIKTPKKNILFKIALPLATLTLTFELAIKYYISYDSISLVNGHDAYFSLILICPMIFFAAINSNSIGLIKKDHSQNIYFFHMLFILLAFKAGIDRGLLCFLITITMCLLASKSFDIFKFKRRVKIA